MKRKILLAVLCVILVAVVGACGTKSSKPVENTADSGQEKRTSGEESPIIKIGVLQLLSHPALDEIYRGLTEELARSGYTADGKNGKKIELDLQNAQGDQSNLIAMAEKMVAEKNNILVGITTPATLSLAKATKEIPIVMAGITYPVEAGLIKDEKQPGTNVTGVSDRTPIKRQLEIMKEILPDLKKMGVLYTSGEDNSAKQIEDVKAAAAELGIDLKITSVAGTNDVQQAAESVAAQVQAIFVPIDNTIASTMPTVVKAADEYHIGVFPSADTMVADGGVLGLGVDQYMLGVKAAQMAIAVLDGADPAKTPIVLANDGIVYLNEKKAEELGIVIPETIRKEAKIVGK